MMTTMMMMVADFIPNRLLIAHVDKPCFVNDI